MIKKILCVYIDFFIIHKFPFESCPVRNNNHPNMICTNLFCSLVQQACEALLLFPAGQVRRCGGLSQQASWLSQAEPWGWTGSHAKTAALGRRRGWERQFCLQAWPGMTVVVSIKDWDWKEGEKGSVKNRKQHMMGLDDSIVVVIFFQIRATRNLKRPHCSMSSQLSKHSNTASSLSALSVSIPASQCEA